MFEAPLTFGSLTRPAVHAARGRMVRGGSGRRRRCAGCAMVCAPGPGWSGVGVQGLELPKFWKDRSQLYRSRYLQLKGYFKEFVKFYNIDTLFQAFLHGFQLLHPYNAKV